MRNNQEGGSGDQRDVPAVGAAAALLLAAAVNANIDRLNCYLYINQKLRKRKEYHLYRLALARTSLRRIFRRGKKKGGPSYLGLVEFPVYTQCRLRYMREWRTSFYNARNVEEWRKENKKKEGKSTVISMLLPNILTIFRLLFPPHIVFHWSFQEKLFPNMFERLYAKEEEPMRGSLVRLLCLHLL